MATYKITCEGGVFWMDANFAQASDNISAYYGDDADVAENGGEDEEGFGWSSTQYQVADFRHDDDAAAAALAKEADLGAVLKVE